MSQPDKESQTLGGKEPPNKIQPTDDTTTEDTGLTVNNDEVPEQAEVRDKK